MEPLLSARIDGFLYGIAAMALITETYFATLAWWHGRATTSDDDDDDDDAPPPPWRRSMPRGD